VIPNAKNEFPKLLCLDMNKWIALARAHYGRPDRTADATALAAIRELRTRGKLIVPILNSNIMDTAWGGDHARRERMARFMVDLSGNTSMVNETILQSLELYREFSNQHDLPIRASLVSRGVRPALLGVHMSEEEALSWTDAASVLVIVNALEPSRVAQFKDRERTGRTFLEGVRAIDAALSPAEKRARELRNLFTDGVTARIVRSIAEECGVHPAALEAIITSDLELEALVSRIPTLDVLSQLMLLRDRSRSHAIKDGDVRDMSFMKSAVPYANIVVGEHTWIDFAKRAKLQEKYETVLMTDLARLPDVLKLEAR
jgi:hypothetical protein